MIRKSRTLKKSLNRRGKVSIKTSIKTSSKRKRTNVGSKSNNDHDQ